MSSSNTGGFGNNLTSILVALIGAISAIGGAWIMTNNQSASQAAPAAQVSSVTEQNMTQPQTSASVAPAVQPSTAPAAPVANASVAAQPPITIVDATGAADAPAPLADSTTVDYEQPWPNQQGLSQLVVERIEVARERVRVHLRFENTSGSPVTFYTATSTSSADGGIQTYLGDKKGPAYGITTTGGALFADPRAVEIPGGTQLRGWMEYSTGKGKKESLSLHFTSQTEGYPSAGTHRVQYEPLPIPATR